MKMEQLQWTPDSWKRTRGETLGEAADLVLAFGSREAISIVENFQYLRREFPNANILSCSSSGEILGSRVWDDTISATAIQFANVQMEICQVRVDNTSESLAAGKRLVSKIPSENLKWILVLSDGNKVNGSELLKGIHTNLQIDVPVTGGLAGDADRFQKTLVGINEAPKEGNIIAIAFYGDKLKIGHGSVGGWDPFGPERLITKSKQNVLYELDGKSALELYKKYLGPEAEQLPSSALLFPLSIKLANNPDPIVRTILTIDEKEQSMTFAGDMPEGVYARLMRANFDRLIDAASFAANKSLNQLQGPPELALLISCVGRKLVLGQRVDEEVESIENLFGKRTYLTGFYSYGEISPMVRSGTCELHNQTMTITTLSEEE
ncbi:MAG: FIST N-terminal domain-containing protein [Spirochaetota bacterium]